MDRSMYVVVQYVYAWVVYNVFACTCVYCMYVYTYVCMYVWGGGAGGLEAQVTTNDQKKWDGRGSPLGAVGKRGTPLPSTLLID